MDEAKVKTMRVLVDADACPVRREIERVAARCKVPVRHYANPSQTPDHAAETITAGDGRDSADFALFLECRPGDIVVTDDLGLAATVLSRGAAALSSRGRRFLPETIASLLHARHLGKKARRAGKRTPGPSPFTPADRQRFVQALEQIIAEHN